MENTAIIKITKYNNKKLYRHDISCYVTLEEIGDLAIKGNALQVIRKLDNKDITNITLNRVLATKTEKVPFSNEEVVKLLKKVQ